MLVNYIKNFSLFLFVFVSFNDTIAEEIAGAFVIKAAFGLFILSHAKELYGALFQAKNAVVKNFIFLILSLVVVTIVTYLFKSHLIYITDLLQVTGLRIAAFIGIFMYVTYTKEFTKLLYIIWISLIVSCGIAFFSESYETGTFRRVGGTGNPNDFAAQLLAGSFMTIYLFKQNKNKVFLIASLLFFFYTLVYTGSKSAFLILGMVLLFIFLVRLKSVLSYLISTKGFMSILLFIGLAVAAGTYFQKDEAVVGMQERKKKSGTMQQRFIIWNAGGEMIRDNFFLGVGFGQFTKVSGDYVKDFLPTEALAAHNVFIKIFAESGVFVFVAFVFFIISLFTSHLRQIYSSDYFWIYVASLSIILLGMTNSYWHHKAFWINLSLISYVVYTLSYKESQDI